MKLRKWLVVAGLGLLLSAGSTEAAFVSLENPNQIGDVITWEVVYDPDGSAGVASLQQNIGIAGDVGNISDVSGTDSGVPAWTFFAAFGDLGAEMVYGGIQFSGDVATPEPIVLGTFSVTWNGLGTVEIVSVVSGYFRDGQPLVELPNTTPAVLETLSAAGPCDNLGGDTDEDTLCDDEDPCKSFANTLPLVISNFSGIPDECLCGDFDGSGSLSATDAAAVNGCAGFVRFDCVAERDDVTLPNNGFYTATDAALINRVAGFSDPAYTLLCLLRPEGTCGGDTGVSCFF